jgi:membrane protein
MKKRFKRFFKIVKNAFKKWNARDPFRQSAIIAYYAIFSLPGLLVVIITLAGYFFGKEEVNEHIINEFSSTMGSQTAVQIKSIVTKASEAKNTVLASIIGIATILFGATGMFAQFQKSLNIIWEVKPDTSKSGFLQLLRVRLFSFGLIVSIAFLLIISLVISALLSAFGDWISAQFSDSILIVVKAANYLISFSILTVLFALMYKFLPDAEIKWMHVWIGAIITTLLFELGKAGLSLYFGKANPATGYGAAGAIILIMLWVSYTSMIVFLGAEFTKAYADEHSGKVPPTKIAREDKPCRADA